MRKLALVVVAFVCLVLFPSPRLNARQDKPADPKAADMPPPKEWTDAEARAALKDFDTIFDDKNYELPVLEEVAKAKAVKELRKVDHRLVAKRLIGLLREKRDRIWKETVDALANMKRSSKIVVPALAKRFKPNSAPPPRTVRILRALAAHKAKKLSDECVKLFLHDDDQVALTAIEALGGLGDLKILPKLRDLFELNDMDPSRPVSVRVDTGAPGNRDARAAAALGRRMQKARRVNVRKEMLEVLKKTLYKLTGKKFEKPEELREWMDKNKSKWR